MTSSTPTKKLWFRVFLVALGFAVFTSVGDANHSWSTYHWARTSNPFTLKTVDSVTSGWQSYLNTTTSDWSVSLVLDLVQEQGNETLTGGAGRRKCNAIAGKIRVCNAAYGQNGWLGLAQIWLTNGHISQGTTKVNDSYSAYFDATPGERQHVMCQEVGHDLGLTHTSEDGSSQQTCMDYSSDINSQNPNAHDYEQLETIYAHTDSFSTVSQAVSMPDAMKVLDFSNPATWGRLIAVSENGRGAQYKLDLGGGNAVITSVYYVPGGRGRPGDDR